MYRIAIGTASEYKINAIKKSLYELDFEFEVTNAEVDSGVSEQPMNVGESQRGAINRAKSALKLFSEMNYGLGVEFGYEPINGSLHIICHAAIVDKEGKTFIEQSSTLELPASLASGLEKGLDVSSQLDELRTNLKDIERHRLFYKYLKKRPFIYEAVFNVGLRLLLDRELYS